MISKFKALGLAMVAMLAIGALSASAASADTPAEFTGQDETSLFGEQPEAEPHVFSAGGGNVQCDTATFTGEGQKSSKTQTITPVYDDCTAFGLNADITMNGCDYLFHAGTMTKEGGIAHGSVDLVCPEGKEVTIDTFGNICTVHIPPKDGINGITYTNNAGHVDVNANANNIKATITKNSFLCPLSNQTVENATYKGDVTLIGDGGATPISVS